MTILKRLRNNSILAAMALMVFAVAFTSCDDDSDGQGTMSVSLTDAPAAYEEVNVEIRQVLVHQSGNADIDDDEVDEIEEGDGENGEWKVVMEDSININLLDYQNGATLDLGEVELDAGQYQQVRLILGENNNVVIDGETYALTTPSAQQSGYKLNVNADIEAGEVYDLVIDFDASQSIVSAGLSGNFILKPVLRTVELESTGSISGNVMPLDAEPFVYAIMGQDTMGTQVDAEGDFKIIGLSEGSYDVWIAPTLETYSDTLITDIELEEQEDFEFEESIDLEVSSN